MIMIDDQQTLSSIKYREENFYLLQII